VLDFLSAIEVEQIEIQLRDGDGPVVLTPLGDDPAIAECLYVIMPIRL
jgi:DNA polymerase III sliding clamp (beta) subunit (PCNA family)